MGVAILQAETLNLPEAFASKLRGKKVELMEVGDTITIKPIQYAIDAACGMLEGSSFGTETIMEQKRLEKELEYGE
jgi:virulence-associated protein VagC